MMRRILPARIVLISAAAILLFSALVFRDERFVEAAPTFEGVLTYHNNNQRTGWNPSETALTFKNVNSSTFGKLFVIATDGLVDAQPLYASNVSIPGNGTHNVLLVATEHDTVYGFDADTGSTIWQATTLAATETPSDNRGCSQVTPEIGITSTPVIDLTERPHGTIYELAMSKD